MGRVRRLLQARSLRARGDLPVHRRHRRASATGSAAGGCAGRLGNRRGWPQIAAWIDGRFEDVETVRAFFQDLRARGLGDPLLVVSDRAPGRSRNASPARRASAVWRIGCAQRRSRPILGPNSRRGSPPAIRRPRARLRVNWRPASAPITPTCCQCARLFRGRFRGLHRAPAPAGHAPSLRKDDKSPRTAVRRRRLKIIPNGFGEQPVLKLMFGALIRGRRAMARPPLHRIRAPSDRRRQKGTRRRISRFNHAAGPVIPAPSFQQIPSLTRPLRSRTRLALAL